MYQNQMVIDQGNAVPVQQTTSDFEWLNLMNQDTQQPQHFVQRRPRANTIATATSTQYQVVAQPQVINQQQQMLNQQQLINQQQQQIINQQQQQMMVTQPATLIINQTQPTTQQPILVQQPAQPAQIIIQQNAQPILVQTSPQTPTQQIIVQENIPVTAQNNQFTILAQQGRQRANTIPGSTAPPYPPQKTTSSSPYNSTSQVKPAVTTPPAGKIAISSNHTKSIPAASPLPGMIPMMGFPNKLSRDLFTQSEHLRKLDEELDKVDFDDVTVYELKDLLRKRGLPSSGKKAILTERLLDEKRNAETRKRNFLEAEELRKKGQLNMNGLCSPNQIMDLYGGISALTTQELPVQNIASPSSAVTLQPIMPIGVNQVKTRQRSYSDSRLTRPNLMETSPSPSVNSSLKNQISFQDYSGNVMQTDVQTVVTTADQTVAYASPDQSFQQVNIQPNVVYTQQPPQIIQIQNDTTWNQNNNNIIPAQNEIIITYQKPLTNVY
jgi:hypothetical protein